MTIPKVSIIITFYNLEDYVEKCLNSLVNQTLTDIEVICVNDGSTDKTVDKIKKFVDTDRRIILIDKKNEGVSAARNYGLNQASGEYVMFIDGDDFIELNACELAYTKAIKFQTDIVIFQKKYIAEEKTIYCSYFKQSKYYQTLLDKPYKFFDKITETFESVHAMYCWDKLYKRKFLLYNKIQFPNVSFSEDNLFVIQTLINNPSIIITDDYLYNYYSRRSNSLSKMDGRYNYVKIHINIQPLIIDYLRAIPETSINYKLIKWHINNYYLNVLLDEWNSLYFSKYRKEYLNEIQTYIKKYLDTNENYVKNLNAYTRWKRLEFLAKFHIYGIYTKIIKPIKIFFMN